MPPASLHQQVRRLHASNSSLRQQLLVASILLFLLLAAAWSFSAGLGGRMIFDDEPNLHTWSSLGDIRTWRDVLAFITSSTFFPGRPLSMLSFLIDDQSWQPDIVALKRTNLALHLLNACLVFWVGLKLLRYLLPARSVHAQAWLALFAAALWTVHPLQVSNVSYVIQRMNLLSTMLELTGLLLYLHGREQLAARPWRAALLCSVAIGLFMPLAILAKENGLLLCAFALLVEAFCFPRASWRWWPAWKLLFLWGPLLLFLAYVLVTYRGFTVVYPTRNFNSWERLLTQGPILVDYLDKLLLPRLRGAGLYYDNFPVSRSLLTPPWTLFAWLLLGSMLALGWRLRQRLPLFAFGIFFFFIGHLMESTLLPLELYFEHRNYLPQLGLWLALAALLGLVRGQRLRRLLAASAVVLVLILLWMTRHNATLWSQSGLQAAVWYHDNPGSLRTTLSYANSLVKKRHIEEAGVVLDRARLELPDYLIVALAQKYVRCYLQDQPADFTELVPLARRARYETASLEMLELLWRVGRKVGDQKMPPGICQPATLNEIAAIYQALLENPSFTPARMRASLNANLAAWSAERRDLDAAMHYYDRAFASEANPLYPFEQAMLLLSAGLPEESAAYAERAHASLTLRMRLAYPAMEANLKRLDRALRHHRQRESAP